MEFFLTNRHRPGSLISIVPTTHADGTLTFVCLRMTWDDRRGENRYGRLAKIPASDFSAWWNKHRAAGWVASHLE